VVEPSRKRGPFDPRWHDADVVELEGQEDEENLAGQVAAMLPVPKP
jgi:hypothetical protein